MTATDYEELAKACSWADELSRGERREWAAMLLRAGRRSFDARKRYRGQRGLLRRAGLTALSAEMADLHLDVTERAATLPPVTTEEAERWLRTGEKA
jgi:hypothetical protein